MRNTFKDCRKTFGGKLNKNTSQIKELSRPIFSKAAVLGSKVEVTSCSKDKGKKRVSDGVLL